MQSKHDINVTAAGTCCCSCCSCDARVTAPAATDVLPLLLLLLTRCCCYGCQSGGETQTKKALAIATTCEHLKERGLITSWYFRTTPYAKYSALLHLNKVG
jgi:hypothetical protein